MRRDRSKWIYNVSRASRWVAGIAVAAIGASLKVNPDNAQLGFLGPMMEGVQLRAWWLIPILAFAGAVLSFVLKALGPPWIWDTVHEVLDDLKEQVFRDRAGDIHHHRATLFKHQKFCWRRFWKIRDRGWLVPVERSGHTTRKTSVLFRAPDNPDKAEGVAGLAWAADGTVDVHDLPDVSGDDPSPGDLQAYADNSNVSVTWIKKEKPHARSLSGFPVEARGLRWGVIVLDSRSSEEITDEHESYKIVGPFLGRLLKRI